MKIKVGTREHGFTAVEILVGIVLFGIIVTGLSSAYNSIRGSYTKARQLSEMYAVLSACPEVDRALEYSSLSGSTNCYPNNSFQVENSSAARSITYTPVPDSKVVSITLPFPNTASAKPLQIRMLITRNGIGQQ
jgi:prepilin-type N-terminal cleavage/methylation domain-containing protein